MGKGEWDRKHGDVSSPAVKVQYGTVMFARCNELIWSLNAIRVNKIAHKNVYIGIHICK